MLDGARLGAHEVRTKEVERRGGGVRLDLVFEVVGTADLEDVKRRGLHKMRGGAWRVVRVRVRVGVRVRVRVRVRRRLAGRSQARRPAAAAPL